MFQGLNKILFSYYDMLFFFTLIFNSHLLIAVEHYQVEFVIVYRFGIFFGNLELCKQFFVIIPVTFFLSFFVLLDYNLPTYYCLSFKFL